MEYKLQDLIDIKHFQSLQDKLNEIYSFPSAIIDNDGNILTATAWQDICTKFHRVNSETEKECRLSDQYIISHIHEANPAVSYKCPHGLVDNATPIIIDGVHYGNFFTGQFFLEKPDLDFFKTQAKKYGFDEETYLEVVKKVPIWSKAQLNSYLSFIREMIEVISNVGLKNIREIEIGEKIKESEEQFRSIFQLAPSGMILLGIDGKFIKVNNSFCDMLGYSETEILSMTLKDITHLEDISLSNQWINDLLNSKKTIVDFEKRYNHKSGKIVWGNVRALLKKDADGSPLYFITHVQDITEQKLASNLLKESQSLYRDLVETSQDLVWQCDAEGKYVYLNPAWEEVFGYKLEEMLGKKFTDFQTHEWAERDLKEFERLLKGNTVKGLETVHIGKDGRQINLVFNAKFVKNKKGELLGTHGTAFNISNYKQLVKSLNESEDKYRTLFENISNSFGLHKIVLNDDGVPIDYIFVEVNLAFEKQTGTDRNVIIGKKVTEIFPGIENDPFDWIGKYGKVAITGEEIRFEQYFQHLDKWYSILAYSNKKEHFATIFTNITEQKQLEAELKKERDYAQLYFDIAGVMFTILNKQGEIEKINKKGCEILGYSNADELIGVSWFEVCLPKNIKNEVYAVFKQLMDGKVEPVEYHENPILTKSGSERIVAFHNTIIHPPDSQISGILFSGEDITDRIKAETAIRESEKRFRSIVENTQAGYFFIDKDGFFRDVNKAWLKLYKYDSADEVIDKQFAAVQQIDDVDAAKTFVDGIMRGDEKFMIGEFSRLCKDGSTGYHSFSARPVTLHGEVIGLEGFIIDNTERKRVTEALLESEEKFRAVAENAPGVISFIDRDGVFKVSAGYGLTEIGLAQHAVEGQSVFELYKGNPILETIKKALSGESCREISVDQNGQYFETMFTPIFDKNHAVSGIINFALNITERKHAEDEIGKLNTELERRVKDRTAELESAKIDLEFKNAELNRFNKLFVGREMRIKELRDKIASLEYELQSKGGKK